MIYFILVPLLACLACMGFITFQSCAMMKQQKYTLEAQEDYYDALRCGLNEK